MAKIGTAYVDVRGDFSGLNREMKGKVSAATKVAGVALAAGIGIALKKSLDEAREAQKIARQTDAVLKSTGNAANVTRGHVGRLADEISRKAGIDDEAVQSAENLLLTFKDVRNETGKGNKIFDQATTVIADMSAAMGQDLKSSTIQVGKALNDPIKGMTALSRVGVTFTQGQKDQVKALVESGDKLKAQKIILKELNSEFAGSAAANADPIDKLNVSVGNLAESVGTVMLPAVSKGADALANLLSGMSSGKGTGGQVSKVFSGIGKGAAEAFKNAKAELAKSGFGQVIDGFKENLRNLWAVVKRAGSGIADVFRDTFGGGSGIGKDVAKIITTVGKLSAASMKLYIAIAKRALPGIITAFRGFARIVRGVVRVISGILTGNFGKAWDGVKDIFSGAFKALRGIVRTATAPLREGVSRIWSGMKSGASAAWRAIYNTVGGWINKVIGIINKIPGVNIGKIDLGGSKQSFDVETRVDSKGNKDTVVRARGGFLAGGGMMQIGRAGDAGRDTIPMAIGGQNVMVGSGEVAAVMNRHQQSFLNARLADVGGLSGMFKRVNKPHYLAGGGLFGGIQGMLPKAGSLGLAGEAGQIVAGLTKHALSKAVEYVKDKVGGLFGGGGSGASGLVPRVSSAVHFARSQGWAGGITSGFRTYAEQARLYALYKAGKGNRAAPPGSSNHEGGEAVDVSDPEKFARAMAIMGPDKRLYRKVPGEPWHFSVTGHARGGFINAAKGFFSAGQIKGYWQSAGGSAERAQLMTAIALAESSGNPRAINHNSDGSKDFGLWQINSVHGVNARDMFNPLKNAKLAKRILGSQGLGAWVAYKTGAYRKFMGQAKAKAPGKKSRDRVINKIGKAVGPKLSLKPGDPDLDDINAALAEHRVGYLGTLLAQANADNLVLRRQMPVFNRFLPYAGNYDKGGIVPGPLGAPRAAIVHGGEEVRTPEQQGGQVILLIEDGAVDGSRIRQISNEEHERRSRSALNGPVAGRRHSLA